MGAKSLHTPYFESRDAVVLKTPNDILEMDDMPPKAERRLFGDSRYPVNSRYTLQWLSPVDWPVLRMFPNNTDAAFVSRKPKPAETLLHYNYGAAAVKHWGRNIDVLTNRPNVPRPSAPQAAPLDPSRVIGDQTKTTGKLAEARDQAGQQLSSGNGGGGSAVAGGHSEKWDEDDVMLFFWGNTKAATERHAKRERVREEKIYNWRAGIVG
ncbi:hypothetical protein D9615_004418 [Tricholomella constricta]|uniref:Uncharacterized protein n=1 Tax=Tricholomella constricta TaxID=117010 RepID=A0A8H5HF32_9AGAR|nr:hypothetical protein D9615_004418 [Tricholomella constricta]